MRNYLPALAAFAVAGSLLASVAHAAFDDEFALVSPTTPAGYYNAASGIPALGQWSATFFPSEAGQSYIDTSAAPASVMIGSAATSPESVSEESTTGLFIDIPADGHVSFSIQSINTGSGDHYAGAEIYLSGVALYFLTDPNKEYVLDFDVLGGETLEFRSVALSTGPAASNQAVISNFVFTAASAVPEPSAYAVLLGLGALGFSARRRRAA
jgi:hypothetical protein